MAERKERRAIARIPLSGTQTVRTHEGVEAHLLDLSLCGARVAHFGILRPGSRCFVQFPIDLGFLYLPVQVLWCVILGAERRPDGERHLRSHSGVWFPTLTAPQRAVLTGLLQQLSTGNPAQREGQPHAASPSLPESCLLRVPAWSAAMLPGTNGRSARGTHAGMVVMSRERVGRSELGERVGLGLGDGQHSGFPTSESS